MSIDVLKFSISMPNAHFRVIHSNKPQKTYPMPPFSTMIGFLANIIGNKEQIETMLDGNLALGILSKYSYITSEYTWLRNLEPNRHIARFGSLNNRTLNETPEHFGGVGGPVTIDVLNDVSIVLFIYHPNQNLFETLKQNATTPEKWFNHLHLGRSEDWAMIDSVMRSSLVISNKPAELSNSKHFFQWMPEPASAFGIDNHIDRSQYKELYQKIQGPALLVTSTYKIINISYKEGESGMIRNFRHIPAQIFCSSIPFLDNFTLPSIFVDPELNVPVYMTGIEGGVGPKEVISNHAG